MFELNKIYQGDNLELLKQMPDSLVSLTITSPPYNLDINYDTYNDKRKYESYLDWLKERFEELYRVTVKGGRVCINVGSVFDENREYRALHMDIRNFMLEIGWKHRCEIIWNKNQISKRTAWGSWQSPSNNKILPPFEYVEVFHKESPKLEGDKSKIDITRDEFIKYTDGLWTIAPESAKKIGHPAPFPEELVYRLIKFYSYQDNVVLDLFNGSGTTTKVAKKLKRQYIGMDLSENYCEIAKRRLAEVED